MKVFAPAFESHDPEWVSTIFQSPFFPVPHERLPNPPVVELIEAGRAPRRRARDLRACRSIIPGGAFAYRVRGMTGDLVYATDHEFGDPEIRRAAGRLLPRCGGASSSTRTSRPRRLPRHRGWGHSDWRQCAEFAHACNAGGLWLFHHKPGRTDEQLVRIRSDARRVFSAAETASEGERLAL